jgi:ribulose-5-phosphate 4-epimerase/fuculose-1-phosphate aldolase
VKIDIGGLSTLVEPTFENVEDERRYRKERLAAALRIFARLGFNEGIAGHLTVRDPELVDHFWVNPFGRNFALLKVSDLVLVNSRGEIVEGSSPVNSTAFAIHAAIHAARPDVVAAAHAHSVQGKAWSTFGELLDPLTQDSCAFYDDHAVFTEYNGMVIDPAEGDRIAKTLGNGKAVILQNHGLLTVGKSIDEAAFWFIAMENSCQVQLLCRAAGTPMLIEPTMARHTAAQVGSSIEGWTQFQPLYEWICQCDPDLFE